jgi:hypothetical protein
MPLIFLLLASTLVPLRADAQDRWRQLPGAASAFSVDLQSLARESGVLQARVRSHDTGTLVLVEELEVRCSEGQLRTVAKEQYDRDTGRPVPAAGQDRNQSDAPWADYAPGSEGHALLSALCAAAQ